MSKTGGGICQAHSGVSAVGLLVLWAAYLRVRWRANGQVASVGGPVQTLRGKCRLVRTNNTGC
jgi:hypothetical protein